MHQITTKSMFNIGQIKREYNPFGTVAFFISHFSSSIYLQSILKMNNKCNKRSEGDEQKKIKCIQFNGKSICINIRRWAIYAPLMSIISVMKTVLSVQMILVYLYFNILTVYKYMANKWICYSYLLLLCWACTQYRCWLL